jgi:hypothetical protein
VGQLPDDVDHGGLLMMFHLDPSPHQEGADAAETEGVTRFRLAEAFKLQGPRIEARTRLEMALARLVREERAA